MLTTLREAVQELTKHQGIDRTKWNWGALHQVHLRHALEQFQLPPAARPGDGDTVNSTGMAMGRSPSYFQTTGASFRELIDLSDWDRSMVINTPGQSGDPQSPHFGDLYPLWLEGKYFPLLFTRSAIEAAAEQRIDLVPGSGAKR
jgi:penicillin amidase